jgi:Tol biopolymer transport system component
MEADPVAAARSTGVAMTGVAAGRATTGAAKNRMLKKLTLISVLVITLMVSCNSRGNKIPQPPSGKKDASELKVTGESEAFIEETQLLSLSPDGKWFFGQRQEAICVFEADTLVEKACTSWSTPLDPNSISWAPGSQRIVFTENINALLESDLWLFDIPSSTLRNLTDDGLAGDLSTSVQRAQADTADINLDTMPVWSPDGKSIAFIRSSYGNTKQTFLCLISASGGEVTKLIIVDAQHSLAVWSGMRWTPDGKKILFTITILDDETGKNGVWVVDKNGKNYKQLVKEREGWGYVSLYDMSATGDKILIGYPRAITRADKNPNLCFFELMDLQTGDIAPLIESTANGDPSGTQREFFSPTQAAFSPDGSKILYHYNLGAGDQPAPQLAIRDVNGTQEEVLGSWPVYTGEDIGTSLFWAENDTIYLVKGPGLGTLYQLGSK